MDKDMERKSLLHKLSLMRDVYGDKLDLDIPPSQELSGLNVKELIIKYNIAVEKIKRQNKEKECIEFIVLASRLIKELDLIEIPCFVGPNADTTTPISKILELNIKDILNTIDNTGINFLFLASLKVSTDHLVELLVRFILIQMQDDGHDTLAAFQDPDVNRVYFEMSVILSKYLIHFYRSSVTGIPNNYPKHPYVSVFKKFALSKNVIIN